MDERVGFFRIDGAAAADTAPTPAPAKRDAQVARPAAPSRASGAGRGPVGRMQASLATALKQDPEWKEF
jgi:hypothetical protein